MTALRRGNLDALGQRTINIVFTCVILIYWHNENMLVALAVVITGEYFEHKKIFNDPWS
jgi:hypothetical protein